MGRSLLTQSLIRQSRRSQCYVMTLQSIAFTAQRMQTWASTCRRSQGAHPLGRQLLQLAIAGVNKVAPRHRRQQRLLRVVQRRAAACQETLSRKALPGLRLSDAQGGACLLQAYSRVNAS